MRNVSCRTARLWLQAPRDLDPSDSARLATHLLACSECSRQRDAYAEVDRTVRNSLGRVTESGSLRSEVRARIAAEKMGPNRGTVRASGGVLALGGAALVAAIMLVAGFGHFPLDRNRSTETVSAGWRLVRPEIGFPLTVDAPRPQHLLVGAFGRVYESWNRGEMWHPLAPLPAPSVIRDLAVDASSSRRYLVATKHSVFLSSDAGRHWRPVVSRLRGAENMFILQNPRAAATFYLGPSVLWKSSDHGTTWREAGASNIFAPYGIQTLSVARDRLLVTGIWAGGVAVSADGGATWQRRSRGLPPDVMNVVTTSKGVLWANTDRGAFQSRDAGRHWTRTALPARFFNTSFAASARYLLAGGNGGLYRSTDGGAHWELSMNGLPLDPYIYALLTVPGHPQEVYASLNSDGIFRSDDGGRHWKAIGSGLPSSGGEGATSLVLYRQAGSLWIADTGGGEPTALSIDRDVKRAALTRDGAGAAYVEAKGDRWWVRTLSAGGGSRIKTILEGSGVPPHLSWSPNTSLLATVRNSSVTVSNLGGVSRAWAVSAPSKLLDWSGDGRHLLFWEAGHIVSRDANTGLPVSTTRMTFPSLPALAPDGKHLAYVASGNLVIGTWRHPQAHVVRLLQPCAVGAWSDDSTRVLLHCPAGQEERDPSGALLVKIHLPTNAQWAPGSHSSLLFFRQRGLWKWSPGEQPRLIASGAEPVAP